MANWAQFEQRTHRRNWLLIYIAILCWCGQGGGGKEGRHAHVRFADIRRLGRDPLVRTLSTMEEVVALL
jgi:hypothetical protein